MLFDEPFSSLDQSLTDRLRTEIGEINAQSQSTFVFVTHDLSDAFALSKKIALIDAGEIKSFERPETLYQNPKTVFEAEFLNLGTCLLYTSDAADD